MRSSVTAVATSSIWPIAETRSVGGTLIFTPPIVESFFMESLPDTSGVR